MRIERDSMGEMEVPDEALYGASTQRAVLNFPISKKRLQPEFIRALGYIKKYAALVNKELGKLPQENAEAISLAADEVISGALYSQFVVDVYQTGSGTSTNMNANEVIANRAIELLGKERGDRSRIHPNDDVNLGQSSNDVFPSAMHIAAVLMLKEKLIPALENLASVLHKKENEFTEIVKTGRTHLQDATPITLGQEFSGYASQIEQNKERLEKLIIEISELALGGTAVGTGLNTDPTFAGKVIELINKNTGCKFYEAKNHFSAQATQDSIVALSGGLKTLACSLIKIANDIRWLGAGPRCSLGELHLPEIQPGSSIMPGKVNPVICESVMMVACQVIGYDTTITLANQHSNFELNTMMPVMAYSPLDSIEILSAVVNIFGEMCISGIVADKERCQFLAEASLSNCTALAPIIGYDAAAKVAKKAVAENLSIKDAAIALGVVDSDKIDEILNIKKMTNNKI